MNKQELISALAKKLNIRRPQAADFVAAFSNSVIEALIKGEKVVVQGLGIFDLTYRKARTGTNPRTGQKIQIPAMSTPAFRPGSELKRAVK